LNEHKFTKAVIDKLPASVHVQSMTPVCITAPGTPDRYLDYNKDLWAEFKMAKTHGRDGYDMQHRKNFISARQELWLNRRYAAGQNVCVVVGVPSDKARGFILWTPQEWCSLVLPEVFIPRLRYSAELAAQLLERVR